MANSIITVLGDGVTTQYPLNFTLGILKREYVTCRVGDEVDGLGDPAYRTLEWVTDGLVNIQGAVPGDDVPIVFKRTIPKTVLLHNYSDGVPIVEGNLDESNLQHIMAIHEFLDGRLDGGFVQDLPMNGFKITGLADGVDDNDAANMSQINAVIGTAQDAADAAADAAAAAAADAVQTGLDRVAVAADKVTTELARDQAVAAANGMKYRSVRVATTGNITLSGTQTIDTVAVIAGDRVLVRAQTAPAENGLYVVAAGAWTRASDADTWNELVSSLVVVEEGTSFGDYTFLCTSNQGGTLGSTSVTYVNWTAYIAAGQVNTTMLGGDITAAAKTLLTAADETAQRAAIGAVKQTSASDTTAGSLLIVGGFGLGAQLIATETNLNLYLTPGKYITPAGGLSNLPTGWAQARHIVEVTGGSSYAMQLITSAAADGLFAVRKYNGTTWGAWATFGAAGEVLNTLSTTKLDTFSTASTSPVDITGLSVAITPKSTSNKVLVTVNIQYDHSSSSMTSRYQLMRNSTFIGVGTPVGSRSSRTAQTPGYSISTYGCFTTSFSFLDSPASVAAQTYKVQADVTAGTLYVNRNASDTDSVANARLVSTITVQEIRG